MVEKQRAIAQGKNVVCEGRDIGTVVFPYAQVKIFTQADLEVRAQRRTDELSEKKMTTVFAEVMQNLAYRDQYDTNRLHSPLKKADNAIVVDTTNLTIDEEISLVEQLVKEKIQKLACSM